LLRERRESGRGREVERDAGWIVVEGSGKYKEEKREEEKNQWQATQQQEKRKEGEG
jgi:hypothetical protein